MRTSFCIALLSSFFLVVWCSAAEFSEKSVGRDVCAQCHSYERRTVGGTPHDDGKNCEGCHGPGEQHVKSGGGKDKVFSFSRATATEVRARCTECHRNAVMTEHAVGDVACTTCHSSHHYARKKYLLKADDTWLHDPA